MVSTVEKVIHEKTVDDAGLLGVLERLAAEARSSPG
jgi:hypothetical protein